MKFKLKKMFKANKARLLELLRFTLKIAYIATIFHLVGAFVV